MKLNDIMTVGVVVIGLGVIGAIVFVAPEAPELNYGAVEVAGTVFAEYSETSDGVITVKGEMGAPGYVTVHTSIGGAPGPVIGQSGYLEQGPFMTSMVVQQSVAAGETYVVLAYKDDGDATLAIGADMPIASNGKVVRADIVAQTFPEVE